MPGFLAILAPLLLVASLPVLVFALLPSRSAKAEGSYLDSVIDAESARGPALTGPIRVQQLTPVLAPRSLVVRLERNLALAGLSGTWAIGRIVLAKNLLAIGALLFAVLLVTSGPGALRLLVGLAVIVVAYLAPDLIVWGRAQERQEIIQNELADTLDQITISIEAGLGLETAVARAGAHGSGPLAEELVRTVQDMQVGLSRREAYIALGERTSVTDLKRFARAIMQADAYGVSVGNVVRSQAKELRVKRRQRAEEKAMRIPVKVLFPLMLCILPVLFIVILGPAAINLFRVFAEAGI